MARRKAVASKRASGPEVPRRRWLRRAALVAAAAYLACIWLDAVGTGIPTAILPAPLRFFVQVAQLFPRAAVDAIEWRAKGYRCRDRRFEELNLSPYFPIHSEDKEGRFDRAMFFYFEDKRVLAALDAFIADAEAKRGDPIGGVMLMSLRTPNRRPRHRRAALSAPMPMTEMPHSVAPAYWHVAGVAEACAALRRKAVSAPVAASRRRIQRWLTRPQPIPAAGAVARARAAGDPRLSLRRGWCTPTTGSRRAASRSPTSAATTGGSRCICRQFRRGRPGPSPPRPWPRACCSRPASSPAPPVSSSRSLLAYLALADRLEAFTVTKLAPALVLALVYGPWGARFGVDAWRRHRRQPDTPLPTTETSGALRFFQLFLVVMYSGSEIAKLRGDWLTKPVLWSHLHDNYQTAVSYFLVHRLPAVGWRLLQWATLVFEVGAPLWFALRPTRTPALVAGLGMHTMIGLMFGPVIWFALLMASLLVASYAPSRRP